MLFDDEDREKQIRKLITRETATVRAGNRFTYFPPVIDFSYKAVCESLADAIAKEAEATKTQVSEKAEFTVSQENYDSLMEEAKELWSAMLEREDKEEMIVRVQKRIQIIFGTNKKISEITEDQVGLLQLVVNDMHDLLA